MIDPFLRIADICRRNGLQLTDVQASEFRAFVDLLLEWNSKVNLISRKDQESIWTAHVLHSLSILFMVEVPWGSRVLDLGTGGGFPGIPISIARPDLNVILLDSIRKKVIAVEDIIKKLPMTNVSVVCSRVEDLPTVPNRPNEYDVILSRAVAPLASLIKWSKPLARKGGQTEEPAFSPRSSSKLVSCNIPFLVVLKGGDLEKEIRTAKIKTDVTTVRCYSIDFDGSDEMGVPDKKIIIVEL